MVQILVNTRTDHLKVGSSQPFLPKFSIINILLRILMLQLFKFPLTIVSCHLIMKFFLSILFRHVFQCLTGKKRVTLSLSTNFSKLAPVGFSAGLDVGLSNWGLELITVSLCVLTLSILFSCWCWVIANVFFITQVHDDQVYIYSIHITIRHLVQTREKSNYYTLIIRMFTFISNI